MIRNISVLFLFVVLFQSCFTAKDHSLNEPVDKTAYQFLENEVRPIENKPCFEGAYYRKLVSSEDYWMGINGRVVLPQLHFDEERRNPKKPLQFLDNPSVYLGGSMGGQETDIGLAWEIIKEQDGSVSTERKAFRPFLRRTGHVSGQKAVFENAPAESKYYWYPGEEVYMSVKILTDKKIRFIVEGAGKRFERDFDCDGYRLGGISEFKRVNAIDQVANEGKPVQPTKTKILDALWKETNLYRSVNGEVVEVPFHKGRYTQMTCPSVSNFLIVENASTNAVGGENISISGKGF